MISFASKIRILLCIVLLLTSLSQPAFAAVRYTATQVYFADNGNLIVKGFWSNSNYEKTRIKDALVEVYLPERNGKKDLLTKCIFPQMNVTVPSGEIIKYNFGIKGPRRVPINGWYVIVRNHHNP